MARLPIPGGDVGNWGEILNQYLLTSHETDGRLKESVVADSIQAGSITEDKLDTTARTKLNTVASQNSHSSLTDLANDDHPQYLNITRGDARYFTQGQVNSALAGKADTSSLAAVATSGNYSDLIGAPSSGGALGDLSDVTTTGASNGEVLTYNAGSWAPAASGGASDPSMGGDLTGTASNAQIVASAVGTTELADNAVADTKLQDGSVTNAKIAGASITPNKLSVAVAPTSGQILSFSGSGFDWVDAAAGGATTLDSLTDVSTGGASDGQSLVYQSGNWIPATVTGSGGVTDHGALTGLADDDHPQYLNNARGDTRYYTQSQIDTALGGKSNTGHTHPSTQISDSTSTGRSLLTAADATAARAAIGAGTSNFDGNYSSLAGRPTLGSAADNDESDFAASGHTHANYLQDAPSDGSQYARQDGGWAVVSGGGGVTDHGALTGLGDDDHPQYALANGSRGSFATTAQGSLADSAVQPGDLAAVATSGDYNDLSNTPTAPSVYYGQVMVSWNGSAWRCRGQTITARSQTLVAPYNDGGYVLWDTTQDASITTPPSLAIPGDRWMHEGTVTPVLT